MATTEEAMTGKTAGLDLQPQGDDFVMSVEHANGTTTKVILTADQLLILAQSAPRFRDHILSKRHPSAGNIDAVLATPVAQIGLNTDALEQEILLTMIGENRARLSYAVPEHLAQELVDKLPKHIARLREKKTAQ